ncbi:MAG: polyphosphate polymerase domain-containing protein [Bacteroidetes bacterium]|nr:polyphosphate polymerase domain-containing protein [Bacteroidota bacterium]
MQTIKNILNDFAHITLKEMDSVKLMDRTDTKFVFNIIQLPKFLEQLKENYSVLDVNGNRISRYESLYFDTQNFDLYHCHHRGKTNRFKIRFRKYVESELHFFEIKFKNSKGRTIKNRVKQEQIDELIQNKAELLLNEKTTFRSENLKAKLWVNYSRITLVNKHSPERVTIDLNLNFKNTEQDKTIHNLVIAEVKQDKALVSAFIKLMKKSHIREGSISKYCYGVINLFSEIKHNNFKPNLNLLKKILYDTTARAR